MRIVICTGAIHILPLASDVNRLGRLQRLKDHLGTGCLTTAGLAHGGGVMDHAAHAGLKDAGLAPTLAMVNEIDEDLAGHAAEHNDAWGPATAAYAAPMQELAQDDWAMDRLGPTDILTCGIPCSGASLAGKSRLGLKKMEDHAQVGHLVASAIMLIQRIKPAAVVVECVPQYAETGSAQILRQHLRDCGYDHSEIVMDASEFGSLEARVRWFFVAVTRGIPVDFSDLAPRMLPVRTIGDILEPVPLDSPEWRTFDYLLDKQVRDELRGNGYGFAMQVVSAESTTCPTLRKGYQKGGSTDPLLAHPSDPRLLRQFSVVEHARIKGIPSHLVAGLGKTKGHALLGQGVAYAPVRALFRRLGEALVAWGRSGVIDASAQGTTYRLSAATG